MLRKAGMKWKPRNTLVIGCSFRCLEVSKDADSAPLVSFAKLMICREKCAGEVVFRSPGESSKLQPQELRLLSLLSISLMEERSKAGLR
jgi:hypothetical protein